MHESSAISHLRGQGRRGSLFPLGRVRATFNALRFLPKEDIRHGVIRHAQGDWGDVSEDEWRENEFSLRSLRLFSVYHDSTGQPFWIITEADRSQTTVLLPDDCRNGGYGRAANPAAEAPCWPLIDDPLD